MEKNNGNCRKCGITSETKGQRVLSAPTDFKRPAMFGTANSRVIY
jgi:hypothetical protein